MEVISSQTRAVATPDTLLNIIEGESVLLNLKNETYYGLDEIGTDMWQALTTTDSTQAAFEQLLNDYDVQSDELRADLLELIELLQSHGLMQLSEKPQAK